MEPERNVSTPPDRDVETPVHCGVAPGGGGAESVSPAGMVILPETMPCAVAVGLVSVMVRTETPVVGAMAMGVNRTSTSGLLTATI